MGLTRFSAAQQRRNLPIGFDFRRPRYIPRLLNWFLSVYLDHLIFLNGLIMQSTHNKLAESIRAQFIKILNKHLAAAIDLHAQVIKAHWNVSGPNVIALHGLFDKVSEEDENFSDQLAERAGGLDGTAHGTLQVAAARSFLLPYPHGIADGQQHMFAVAGSLAAFGQSVREAIKPIGHYGDLDTVDLFTKISRATDLQLWFIETPGVPKNETSTSLKSDSATRC